METPFSTTFSLKDPGILVQNSLPDYIPGGKKGRIVLLLATWLEPRRCCLEEGPPHGRGAFSQGHLNQGPPHLGRNSKTSSQETTQARLPGSSLGGSSCLCTLFQGPEALGFSLPCGRTGWSSKGRAPGEEGLGAGPWTAPRRPPGWSFFSGSIHNTKLELCQSGFLELLDSGQICTSG